MKTNYQYELSPHTFREMKFHQTICYAFFLSRFPITKKGVHVGLGVTSDDGLVAFNLKENQDNSSVNKAIDKLTYPGGGSNLGKALTKTRGWIFKTSSRENVPKILVVLFKGNREIQIGLPLLLALVHI